MSGMAEHLTPRTVSSYLAHDDACHKENIVDDGDHPAPLHVRRDIVQQLLVPLRTETIFTGQSLGNSRVGMRYSNVTSRVEGRWCTV